MDNNGTGITFTNWYTNSGQPDGGDCVLKVFQIYLENGGMSLVATKGISFVN